MNPRIRLLSSILPLGFLTGCPPLPPELVTCEEADACDTTGLAATPPPQACQNILPPPLHPPAPAPGT